MKVAYSINLKPEIKVGTIYDDEGVVVETYTYKEFDVFDENNQYITTDTCPDNLTTNEEVLTKCGIKLGFSKFQTINYE